MFQFLFLTAAKLTVSVCSVLSWSPRRWTVTSLVPKQGESPAPAEHALRTPPASQLNRGRRDNRELPTNKESKNLQVGAAIPIGCSRTCIRKCSNGIACNATEKTLCQSDANWIWTCALNLQIDRKIFFFLMMNIFYAEKTLCDFKYFSISQRKYLSSWNH